MCTYYSKQSPYAPLFSFPHLSWPSKRHHRRHLRLGLLNRRKQQFKKAKQMSRMIVVKADIEMKNLKLYMENQSIIQENEKLRKKAILLHKENQVLYSQLQKKLSEQNSSQTNSITN